MEILSIRDTGDRYVVVIQAATEIRFEVKLEDLDVEQHLVILDELLHLLPSLLKADLEAAEGDRMSLGARLRIKAFQRKHGKRLVAFNF